MVAAATTATALLVRTRCLAVLIEPALAATRDCPCAHALSRLNLGAIGGFPASRREIEGFEPCRRGQGNHVVRDDVVLQDESFILGFEYYQVAELVENSLTYAVWLSAIAYHRNYLYFLAW